MPEWVGDLVVQLGVAVVGGFVAGRLLGIRLSWGRWLVALLVGVSAGGITAWLLAGQPLDPGDIDPWVVFTASLFVTMVVAADPFGLIGPPGRLARVSTVFVRVPRMVGSARRGLERSRRYAQVVRIAARNGLVERADDEVGMIESAPAEGRPRARRLGYALRSSLEEAGGAFVKLGQILSTRPDLLPPEVTTELSRLQDDVAAEPRDRIERLLGEELGSDPNQVFAEFDPNPLAAASVAQVHRARLRTGEPVAVKVQRPRVRDIVERDLDITRRLATAVEARTTWGREIGAVDLADGFAVALLEELDFRIEARNTTSCRNALDDSSIVRIPAVHDALSTDRVLVLEWMEGVSVRHAEPLIADHNLDRTELARGLLRAMLRLIMIHGVFHADPHPGNVFVRADGTLALIDLGSVGRLDSLQQSALMRAVLAMSQRDPRQLRDALVDVAQAPSATDEDLLERALGQLLVQRLAEGMQPDAKLFAALLNLMLDFGLAFPPQVAAVFRALVTLDGTLAQLDPDFNILDEAKATASSWIDRAVLPEELQEVAAQEALSLLPVLRRLPRRVDRIASAAERGDFSVNVRLFADRRDMQVVNGLVNRALLTLVAVGLGFISVQLLDGAAERALGPLELLGYVGLGGSVVLLLRVLVAILGADR